MNLDLGDTRLILTECKIAGLLRNQAAYVLATAFHETGRTMKPVREAFGKTDDQAIARLESSWKKGRMPWVKKAYWRKDAQGKSWLGRGYVQLTHKENYARAGSKLRIDLTTNPDVVMDPMVAGKIIVMGMKEGWFTGKKLSDYVTLQKSRFVDARRIVNGTDRARDIAAYAKDYNVALKTEGYDVQEVFPPPPDVEPITAPKRPDRRKGWLAGLTAVTAGGGSVAVTEGAPWEYIAAGVFVAVIVGLIVWRKWR